MVLRFVITGDSMSSLIKITLGFLLGVTCSAAAVNYARDIEPLNTKVESLEFRVKQLESAQAVRLMFKSSGEEL